MRAVRTTWHILATGLVLLTINHCTLRWQDMRGFACENDAQCGPAHLCISNICGGITKETAPENPQEDDAGHPEEIPTDTPTDTPTEKPGCGVTTPDKPVQSQSFAHHLKWVKAAGGEASPFYQRNMLLPVGNDLYLVGAYRTYRDASPPQSTSGQTYGMIAKFNQAGELQWVESITGNTPDIRIHDVAYGNDNSLIVAGMFYGTARFGTIQRKAIQDGDAFVAKYNLTTRTFIWVSTWGGSGYDEAWKVVVNSSGEVFVSGSIKGKDHDFTADGKATQPMTNRWNTTIGNSGGFLVKLSAKGQYMWHKLWGSVNGYNRAFVYPDLRSDSHIYVLVYFKDLLFDIEDHVLLQGNGEEDTALLRIETTTSRAVQTLRLGGESKSFLVTLAQDRNTGDLFLAGAYSGQWEVTRLCGTKKIIRSQGALDNVLMRLTDKGRIKWVQSFGGNQTTSIESIVLMPDGSVFGIGGFRGLMNVGSVPLQSAGKGDDANGFLAKFDSQDGHVLGAWSLQGPWSLVTSIKAGAAGLYLSGTFRGQVQFGNQTISPTHAIGGSDNFLLHFVP